MGSELSTSENLREVLADALFRLWAIWCNEFRKKSSRPFCEREVMEQTLHIGLDSDWHLIPDYGKLKGYQAADRVMELMERYDPCRDSLTQAIQMFQALRDKAREDPDQEDDEVREETDRKAKEILDKWRAALEGFKK